MDRIRTDTFDIQDKHTFLFNHQNNRGILTSDSKKIPTIREYINDLPDTAATFQLNHIDEVDDTRVDDRIMEFLGSWQLDERYGQGRERWVNPNYVHAAKYTDAIVDCDCGAQMILKRDVNISETLMDTNNHNDTCQPFMRMRARAEISEMRYHQIRRLSWMGWRGPEMSNRLGISEKSIGKAATLFGTNIKHLYKYYHAAIGQTFHYLVETKNVDPELVTDIYGHSRTYLRRLERQYVREDKQLADVGDTTVPALV